jgi:SAM-dependent methyltransferase
MLCQRDNDQHMDKHYQGALGRVIFETERQALNSYLEKIFGYHLLQLDGDPNLMSFEHSPIAHKTYFSSKIKNCSHDSTVCGNFDALPFLTDSIDLVVMPHLLETTSNLKSILDEIHRVLIPEGYLIVVGFDPYSFLGIIKKLDNDIKLVSLGKVSSWLGNLNFDLIESKSLFFCLPIVNNMILKMLLPKFGGIYLLVAKKRVITLTPIKHYFFRRRLNGVESSARPTS